MDKQPDMHNGHAAWRHKYAMWTSSMDKQHVHAAWTFNMYTYAAWRHGHAAWTFSLDMQYVHASCTSSMEMHLGHAVCTSYK
jgi:hypothetical protein